MNILIVDDDPTSRILRGKMVMEFSPLVFRRLNPCVITLPGRRNIMARFRFKMSSGNCCGDMKLNLMNGMCGIDSTLSGLMGMDCVPRVAHAEQPWAE